MTYWRKTNAPSFHCITFISRTKWKQIKPQFPQELTHWALTTSKPYQNKGKGLKNCHCERGQREAADQRGERRITGWKINEKRREDGRGGTRVGRVQLMRDGNSDRRRISKRMTDSGTNEQGGGPMERRGGRKGGRQTNHTVTGRKSRCAEKFKFVSIHFRRTFFDRNQN